MLPLVISLCPLTCTINAKCDFVCQVCTPQLHNRSHRNFAHTLYRRTRPLSTREESNLKRASLLRVHLKDKYENIFFVT